MKKNKKNNYNFERKFQYGFETFIGKGTVTMILVLFGATIIVSCIVGFIKAGVFGGNPGKIIWDSFMHTLDAGTLAGDSIEDKPNVIFMTLMTVFGLCFTSVLIGIVNSSFEQKLYDMRHGKSKVMEKNHVVVLGYSYTLFKIIESLVEANANHKNQCVVVVGDEETEVMLDAIKSRVGDFKTTKLICRSGKVYEEYVLERASVESAKSVIINGRNDVHSIKTLLAFTSYIKDKQLYNPDLFVTVVIHDKKFVKAAKLAGGDRVEVIYAKDIISRMIAHACNQRGLCSVFDEVLDFYNNEIYCEHIPEVKGMRFHDALHSFEAQIPIGIYGLDGIDINPDMDRVIGDNDELIMFEADDGDFVLSKSKVEIDESVIKTEAVKSGDRNELVILGQNDRLDDILIEYDKSITNTAVVNIVDTADELKYELSKCTHLEISFIHIAEFNAESIRAVLKNREFNVLVLTDDDADYETADSESMLKLIELNAIAKETGNNFAITCEIRKSSNQRLAEIIGAENFVVGSNIGGLLSVQIAENRLMTDIFKELLSTEGAELYMKPVEDYVETGREMTFDTVLEAFARKNSIVLGFRKIDQKTGKATLKTCPRRRDKFVFNKGDMFVVLSEEW